MITPELIITNSYLAEINFSVNAAAGQRVYFRDIPTLTPRDGKTVIETVALDAFTSSDLSYSPNGNQIISDNNAATLLLTLTVGSRERCFLVPVSTLRSAIQGGNIRRFYNLPINIVKSYVQVVAGGITAGQSVCFNFYYRERQRQS
jgi:hypothetical protein